MEGTFEGGPETRVDASPKSKALTTFNRRRNWSHWLSARVLYVSRSSCSIVTISASVKSETLPTNSTTKSA